MMVDQKQDLNHGILGIPWVMVINVFNLDINREGVFDENIILDKQVL